MTLMYKLHNAIEKDSYKWKQCFSMSTSCTVICQWTDPKGVCCVMFESGKLYICLIVQL